MYKQHIPNGGYIFSAEKYNTTFPTEEVDSIDNFIALSEPVVVEPTEIEKLRADVDYLAMMKGVVL